MTAEGKDNTHAVGLIGAGTIGRAWAVVFARAGHDVRLFDIKRGAAAAALASLRPSLDMLAELGDISSADELLQRVSIAESLEQAVKNAWWVQESVAENAAIKADVFRDIDALAPAAAILASSCSSLPPSSFLEHVPGRTRCLVAHPFNPPYLMPLVELVPSRWTSEAVLMEARRQLVRVGQKPVIVRQEVYGYIGNRLQSAVVNEAMHLVARGAVSPEDLDACLRWGLGLRWAIMGPFETMDLNAAAGISEYASKFGKDYVAMGRELHVADAWQPGAVEAVTAWRRSALPLDLLSKRTAWRDRMLLNLKRLFASDVTGNLEHNEDG